MRDKYLGKRVGNYSPVYIVFFSVDFYHLKEENYQVEEETQEEQSDTRKISFPNSTINPLSSVHLY